MPIKHFRSKIIYSLIAAGLIAYAKPIFASGLIVNPGAKVVITNSAGLRIGQNVNNSGIINAGNGTINVAGNWYGTTGVFICGTSTVTLNGTGTQNVATGGSDANNWNTLVVTNASVGGINFLDGFTAAAFTDTTPGSTLRFINTEDTTNNDFVITAVGGLTLTGTGANNIVLTRYGGAGTLQWEINPSGGGWNVSYVSVSNAVNSASSFINPSNSFDGGNNTNWFSATLVDLVEFAAIGCNNKVMVKWATDSEVNNAGFNIYRSLASDTGYVKINTSLVPGLGTSATGNKYTFGDSCAVNGTTYYYKLDDVEYDGSVRTHGPVIAHPGLDSDSDGMTDDWEIYYGLNPNSSADSTLDSDNDGHTNLAEFTAGTDPKDNTSMPLENGIKIIQSDDYGMILELTTASFETEPMVEGTETYQIIKLPYLHGYTENIGEPQIPVKGMLLGVPFDSSVTVKVIDYEVETLSGYNLYPVPQIHIKKERANTNSNRKFSKNGRMSVETTHKFDKNKRIYSKNIFYPDNLVTISPAGVLRRQDVAKLAISPVQFNPAAKELKFYKKIRIAVDFGGKAETELEDTASLTSPFDKLYKGVLSNYENVKRWKHQGRKRVEPSETTLVSAYKISVGEEGIYRLTWQDLSDAGLDSYGINPKKIKIYSHGEQIPIYVAGEKDRKFNYNDYIEFFAEAVQTRYSSTNVYWLTTEDEHQGLRMENKLSLSAEELSPGNFISTVHFEKDEMYSMDIPDTGYVDDHWFFSEMLYAPCSSNFTIPLSSIDFSSETAIVKITLQGSSYGFAQPDHHALISLNGTLIDDTIWDGNAEYIRTISVPQSDLIEGDNIITLELPGDTGAEFDLVLVNRFDITYKRQFTAEGNLLKFNPQGDGALSCKVTNFTENDIEIFDVSAPKNVKRITNFSVGKDGNYTASFNGLFTGNESKGYIALSSSGAKKPISIVEDEPSTLKARNNQADYIIICHEDFYNAIIPLANHRASQGYNVKIVKVGDIYDEFNGGVFSPEAIKSFLQYTYSEWTGPAPSYILLVGDGTYDYKDIEESGHVNYVPTYMIHSLDFGETGSDNWFVCLDGEDDLLPDMFIGRLPVYSNEQLNTMVNKIISYETAPFDSGWARNVTLVADNLESKFEDLSNSLVDYLPPEYQVSKKYLANYSSPADCKTDIIDAINLGTLLLNYAGHGSVVRWAHESILTLSDIPLMTNSDRLTFIATLTCANGYFVNPPGQFNCLAEELLYSSLGGAVGVLAPTGISYTDSQELLNKGLFESIFEENNFLIGPAAARGKLKVYENAGASGKNVIQTFTLFGDPALELKHE